MNHAPTTSASAPARHEDFVVAQSRPNEPRQSIRLAIWADSSSVRNGRSKMPAWEFSTMAPRSTLKCPIIRSMAGLSKISVANSSVAKSPSAVGFVGAMYNPRLNFAIQSALASAFRTIGCHRLRESSNLGKGRFSSTKQVCMSGLRSFCAEARSEMVHFDPCAWGRFVMSRQFAPPDASRTATTVRRGLSFAFANAQRSPLCAHWDCHVEHPGGEFLQRRGRLWYSGKTPPPC